MHLRYSLGRDESRVSKADLLAAVSLAVRNLLIDRWFETEQRYRKGKPRRLHYLSLEYLVGRSLANNLINLGLYEQCEKAVRYFGMELAALCENEHDAALGNGGLGRLSACFLDSLATLHYPARGYGINYRYGLFRQEIRNGYQVEQPDAWHNDQSPWLLRDGNQLCLVPVYGYIEHLHDLRANYNPMWLDWKIILGVPHDFPIAGYGGHTVNILRLYSAASSDEFDFETFNKGDYIRAVEDKIRSENISKVLYPADDIIPGKELRLLQEYFLVACSIRDIIRQAHSHGTPIGKLHEKIAIQLNDTHPALAIAELMRLLVDEEDISWEQAWHITTQTFGYTNHTLMPEALEKWPVALLKRVLPRHLQIIYEINRRFLEGVSMSVKDPQTLSRLSIIEEGSEKLVRMANLAIVGSRAVNGVARLHSELIKTKLVPEFSALWPNKFSNKTNGITQRRWLLQANPLLARWITEQIGDGWITDLSLLGKLLNLQNDQNALDALAAIKQKNKQRLAGFIKKATHIEIDSDSLFDVHCKRIHEYKRQFLNVLHILYRYLRIIEEDKYFPVPKTYIFAGKAAPSYHMAKLIIKLIHSVAECINNDPRANESMRVVFIPDYRVSLAELIIPAADASEQISTAGMEASGTGNMKFALNGALTIGTLDGANIEIAEEVGLENMFIFGHTAAEIAQLRDSGAYRPREIYQSNPAIRRVVNSLTSGLLCPHDRDLFRPLRDNLLEGGDPYFLLADFDAYCKAQTRMAVEFQNKPLWGVKRLRNIAKMGKFSSDRTIREYAEEIWRICPIRPESVRQKNSTQGKNE